jgi:hypothetical protein
MGEQHYQPLSAGGISSLRYYYNYSLAETHRCSGAMLAALTVTMPNNTAPGQASVLIEYAQAFLGELFFKSCRATFF